MEWQAYEVVAKRAKPEVRTSVMFFRRLYNFPMNATSLIPTKGSTVTLRDVSGSGIKQPRVFNVGEARDVGHGRREVTVVYYKVRQYAEGA